MLGDKWGEAMRWASEQEHSLGDSKLGAPASRLECAFESHADQVDQIDDLDELSNQMYLALRSTTEGTPFTYVGNAAIGNGLEAWRSLHNKYDPSTGGRKKAMLNALISPNKAGYEGLAWALVRWKTLHNRYEQKMEKFG